MSGHVEAVIARAAAMPARERSEWRAKAERVLPRTPGNPNALRLLAALDASADAPTNRRRISTGQLAWEPHDPDTPSFRGYAATTAVARIFKHATHTATRKAVYPVEIRGTPRPDLFERIEDARQAGERA